MTINFSKAVEGEIYDFSETLKLSDDLLKGRRARFTGDAKVYGRYVVCDDNLVVMLTATIGAEFDCDRCLKPTAITLTTPVEDTFYKTPADEDSYTYTNYEADITPLVDERIIFAIPEQVYCSPDCKGLCPKCGANLNDTTCKCINTADLRDSKFAALLDLNITGGK